MEAIKKKSLVIHPFLFAIFPFIFLFAVNVESVFPEELILPALITLLVAFLLWFFLSFILKNQNKSGLIVSLGLVLFFSYGHFYILFEDTSITVHTHTILGSIFLIIFAIGTYFFIRTKNKLNNATTIVNAVAITVMAISLINIGTFYSDDTNFFESQRKEIGYDVNESKAVGNYHDIYYIILDEYANAEMLTKYLDFDNQKFISFLKSRGFHVASESYSNYARSTASIPSTLNMDYVHLKKDDLGLKKFNYNALLQLTSNNEVMKYLKSKGYTIVSFTTTLDPTRSIEMADVLLCNNEDSMKSEFLPLLFETSALNPLSFKIYSSHVREKIFCIFTSMTNLDDLSENPKFIFAHITPPHGPYVFGPNGEPRIYNSILTQEFKGWTNERYLDQLKFVNKKMTELVGTLLEQEDPPIIIILSDHGFRHEVQDSDWSHPTKEILKKRYMNFKAYYFPDKERNLLLENTTNVNFFRVFFNLYFDENFEILDDKIYIRPSGIKNVNNFTDVTHILLEN